MSDRKQHVITTAHQLFIENGFQATSIQDILDHSNISKGTFYNYFASKNELLMAIFSYLSEKLSEERDGFLIGQDSSDINLFIKQIELEFEYNGKNKLFNLLEEAFFTNDPALKEFFKASHMRHFNWIYKRFIDLFGKSKEAYLLDCTILFTGMLHQTVHFNILSSGRDGDQRPVIRYIVNRIKKVVEEVAESKEQLFKPEDLFKLLPDYQKFEEMFKEKLTKLIFVMKKGLDEQEGRQKYVELLEFIEEELTHATSPRRYLIKSAMDSLADYKGNEWDNQCQKLVELVEGYFLEKH
ncbi:TetR/AcrR family transcriptional regulator [Pullulanibacillus sp. KACC 23026]|uniref:TetR/AcrR family transcriptional regulator n=1 Tax=Pullulanibacillus sp. KACC 23026 TaxID=3028315 RepID=UPI0023AE9F67|nr:TetR/AcrR family transcriptional regulator [Pullulanibacillus sp. KACC 23026]WEG14564.1 TetR/AcrR family transcriptional regulator [Pullulanibacillus sp. KACC 23026]